jgi:hypothetical protein
MEGMKRNMFGFALHSIGRVSECARQLGLADSLRAWTVSDRSGSKRVCSVPIK